MSGWLGCCDCLCPPARALHRSMVAGAARPLPARSGVDNAAYQPDESAAAPCRHCSSSEGAQDEASSVNSQLSQSNGRDWDRHKDPNGPTAPATHQSDTASSRGTQDKMGTCSRCYAAEMPQSTQNQKPDICALDQIPEETTETDHEPADPAEGDNAVGGGSAMANGDSSVTNAPDPSSNGQKRSRLFMFRRRSQPAGGQTRRERQWLQRFSRRSHSTGEFSNDLTGTARRLRPEEDTEGSDQTGRSRLGKPSLRFGRRRGSRRSIAEHEEKDGEDEELEMTAAAAAARKWRRVVKHDFDNDAPLSTHWDFLESVVDDFPRVDVKSYVEHKQHRQPSVSSSSEDEEVPDSQEALLMLRLAESRDIHSDKVERRESLRRGSTTTSQASTSTGSAAISQINGHPVDRSHIHPNSKSPQVQSAPEIRPIMSVLSSWFSPQASSDPDQRSSVFTQWFSPQPRASSCPPPPAGATHPPSADPTGDTSPTLGQTGSPHASANGDGGPVHHQRGSRRSIFDRLFPASIGTRRSSTPISPSDPPVPPAAVQVRTPTWFQHDDETEVGAPDASPAEQHRQRRASVAEMSRRSFLQDVEERTQALREEEFGTSEPHDGSAPQQATDNNKHVIPMMNSQRRVQLMLEDAERRLQQEYSRTPSPSLQRSACSTPDSEEKTANEGPRAGRTVGLSTSSVGAQRRTSLKEMKKLNYAITSSLQGTTAAAATTMALVPYQPIIRTLATEAHPSQPTSEPSTSGQRSNPAESSTSSGGSPSNAHSDSSPTTAEVHQTPQQPGPACAPASSSADPRRHSMLSTGTSTSETQSQSAQTSGRPSASGVQSQSAQNSVKTSTADAQSQSSKGKTDPVTTGNSPQAAQTSTDHPAPKTLSESNQNSPDNTTKNALLRSAQTTTEPSPQRTHPHSTPIGVESVSSPNTPPNLSQGVQTSPRPQKTSPAIQPTHPEGLVSHPLPKEPTSSSAQDFCCQTPGPSVGTSTSERDKTSGLEDVADLRQRAGGASWTLAVSAPRGNRSDLGPRCGAGRQLQPPAAAALRLQLEQQQLAAEQRRQQQLQSRSKRALKLTEGPASGAAAGPSTEGGSEAADKRRREKMERRSKRAMELAQAHASSSEEERENDSRKHSSKRRGSGADAKRRASSGGKSTNEGVEQRSDAAEMGNSKSTRSMAVGTSDHQFPPPPRKTTKKSPKKS